jgi:hypothetical protein
MDKLTNDQLVEVYDKASNITDSAYVFDRFFQDANKVYEKAMDKSRKNNDQVTAMLSQLKMDPKEYSEPKVYEFPKNRLGRWIENTGDEKQILYYGLVEDMENKGAEILPYVQALASEVDEGALKSLEHEYAVSTGTESQLEGSYGEMFSGRSNYTNVSPFRQGAFANQTKKLCKKVAEKRNFSIKDTGESLDFERIFKEAVESY